MPEGGGKTNDFFVNFYQTVEKQVLGIEAREHTAQVPSAQREEREAKFRTGELPILYCSPTMELGVDISELMQSICAMYPYPCQLRSTQRACR